MKVKINDMQEKILKIGGGVLLSIHNPMAQPGKSVMVFLDGRPILSRSLDKKFDYTWPHKERALTSNTDEAGKEKPSNRFYAELTLETDGEVSVVYK